MGPEHPPMSERAVAPASKTREASAWERWFFINTLPFLSCLLSPSPLHREVSSDVYRWTLVTISTDYTDRAFEVNTSCVVCAHAVSRSRVICGSGCGIAAPRSTPDSYQRKIGCRGAPQPHRAPTLIDRRCLCRCSGPPRLRAWILRASQYSHCGLPASIGNRSAIKCSRTRAANSAPNAILGQLCTRPRHQSGPTRNFREDHSCGRDPAPSSRNRA